MRAVALGLVGGAALFAPVSSHAAPTVFRTAPGRFEVSAFDVEAARVVTSAAEEGWRMLAAPLGLPDAFSSPVFVRLVAAEEWRETTPFRTIVEAGAIVSLRLRWNPAPPMSLVRRAVVQALLMRLAVAQQGVNDRLVVPLWLEHACVGWWETHADGAQLDSLQQRSAGHAPATLPALLGWQRGEAEDEARVSSATWLLTFLQAEAARSEEWRNLLRRLLGGEPPLAALRATYPGRFEHPEEAELWWTTGFHHARRIRPGPTLEARESRVELLALQRLVVGEEGRDADKVVSLRTMLDHATEPFVAAEIQRRAAELGRVLPALHPFFRNAGLALAEVFVARTAGAAKQDEVCRAFEADWRDALELESASKAALDALEKR